MTAIVLPHRSLLVRPALVEDICAPEWFADGAVVRAAGQISRVLFYREYGEGAGVDRRHMLTAVMARHAFDRAFVTEAVNWIPGAGWSIGMMLQ